MIRSGRRWAMADDTPESPQRWTVKRRATLIVSLLKGEPPAQAAARKHGLTVAEVEEWRDRFLLGAENALRARPKDEDALKDEQIKKLKQKVGELVLDLDILKEASKDRPFAPKTSDEKGPNYRRTRNAGPARSSRTLAGRR